MPEVQFYGVFKFFGCFMALASLRTGECSKALNLTRDMRIPHSNAFINLDKDFTAGKSDV